MTRSAPVSKNAASRLAAAMSRAWWRDRAEFDELVETALSDGNEEALSALASRTRPNDAAAVALAVGLAAETVPVSQGRWARMMAIPVTVHTDDGGFPDGHALVAALADSGLLPVDATAVVVPDYLDMDGIASMGPCARRALLSSMFDEAGGATPPRADLSTGTPRGARAVIVGALLVSDPDEIRLVDHDLPPEEMKRLLVSLLRTGSGLVDVWPPTPLFALGNQDRGSGVVERSGSAVEMEEFFAHASEAAGGMPLRCEMRPVEGHRGGLVSITLRSPTGETVDVIEVDPYELPMSPGELRRTAEALSERFLILPALPKPTMGFRVDPPPPGVPNLRRIIGGRDKREADERDAWGAGVRKRLAELQKNSGTGD